MKFLNTSWLAKVIIIGPFFYYILTKNIFPFHFQWDTDATVTIDTLLINSGMLPEHINHPSYGMYWMQSLITGFIGRLISSLGYIYDLNTLIACNDMMQCIADYANHLRFLSKIVTGLAISLLLLIIWRIARNIPFLLLALLILVFDEGLIYNSLIIKSELYAFFFCICAVYFLQIANKKQELKYIFLAGIFSGLAYFTKIQYIFYILSIAILVPFIDTKSKKSTLNNYYLLFITIYMAVVFFTAKFGLPKIGVSELAKINFSNKLVIISSFLFVAHLAGNWYLQNCNISEGKFTCALRNQLFFFNGFCTSLLLSLIYGPIFGTKLAAQAYMMGIARDLSGNQALVVDSWRYLQPWHSLIYLFLSMPIFGFGLTIVGVRCNFKKTLHLVLLCTCLFLATVNLLLILRPTYRDIFPAKSLLLVMTLLYSAYVIKLLFSKKSKIFYAIYLMALATFIPIQCMKSEGSVALLNAENTHYGYDAALFTTGYYGGNHTKFFDATKARVDINGYKAKEFLNELSIFRTVFPNLNKNCLLPSNSFSSGNISAPLEISSLLSKSAKYKFLKLDSTCSNKPLVSAKWTNYGPFITYDFFIPNGNDKNAIEILPRPDLKFLLISDHPIIIEYSDYYLKAGGLSVQDWNTFTGNSNLVYEGSQLSSGKPVYIYLVNRYSRLYLRGNEVVYFGYSEKF